MASSVNPLLSSANPPRFDISHLDFSEDRLCDGAAFWIQPPCRYLPDRGGGGGLAKRTRARQFPSVVSASSSSSSSSPPSSCSCGYSEILNFDFGFPIHIFIFFLAVFHVMYSAITMMLGRAKIVDGKYGRKRS